eukprot:CAMPEP_0206041750 /NCGR_PEP_ID=MMETSP1466-20131121/6142_1 /ASSEMBLY_ACC=CAM_ASM_001126 /TAXON_ID=44452 /ORGANISM="Pavlova gyrans, Strain CCMP608" /LENGTH=4121 /DNA_ID=CAMNT_0053416453 /DNA_START=38 /DNA_END=12403 /DNA_ORIENTATION=-
MPRFQLQPLDAPLPEVPSGPLSKLPRVDGPKAPTRYVEPAQPTDNPLSPSPRGKRVRAHAPAPHGQNGYAEVSGGAAGGDPAVSGANGSSAAGAQALYGFNVEELYDYDLPNIRSASATLTAMVGRTVNPVAAARADAARAARRAEAAAQSSPVGESLGDRSLMDEDGEDADLGGDSSLQQHADIMVEDVGSQLKTGEEAANFFARHGNHTPTKFVYANRAKTGDDFLPYSLVCVSREQVEPEHFTISATGVVHVFADKQPSEFMNLSQWIQESTFFNVLTSIRFFKHYLVAKMFRLWRSNVRYKLYCMQRNKLVRRLFLAKTSFCSTLIEIGSLCHDMRTIRLLNIDPSQTYRIGDFLEAQQEERSRANKTFEQYIDKFQALVEKVCRDVTTRARLSDETAANGGEGEGGGANGGPGKAAPTAKSKSMVAARQEQLDRLRAVRLAASEAQMLSSFIRLVDYLCVSCCYTLSVQTAQELLEVVTQTPPRKNGLWSTVVLYGEKDMVFDPPERTFLSSLDSMLESTVLAMNSVPRLLYLRGFKHYFHHGSITGPSVLSTVQGSEEFNEAKVALMRHVRANFEDVVRHARQFERYRVVHVFGEHWSFEAYEAMSHTVDEFKADMKQLKAWKDDIANIVKHKAVGTILVESQRLRDGLDRRTNALDRLQEMLLTFAKDECISTLQEFQQTIKTLKERPRMLKDFAEFCRYVDRTRDEAKSLNASARSVSDMYELLEEYFPNLKIPTADEVKRDDLEEAKKEFGNVFEEALASVEDRKPKHMETLDQYIAKANEELLGILASLHSGDYMDPTQDPKQVLEKLDTVREELDGISERAETYADYQRIFKIGDGEQSLTSIKDTELQYKVKRDIWQRLDTWNESVAQWKASDFADLPVEEVKKEVDTYHKDVYKQSKRLTTDPVVRHFLASVEEVRAYMPVVADLGNPAMQQRHWKRVFERMDQPYFPGAAVTLDQLLQHGIQAHADFIGEVSGIASGEYALEEMLAKIKHGWESTDFVTITHRDTTDVFILGSVEDIIVLLEDNQVALQTILASRFVAGIRTEVEVWEKKLSLLSEVLDEWTTCQRNWMYLENIFGAEDIQKQLPVEASKFQKVDKFWKDQMRKTNDQPNVLEQVTKAGLLKHFAEANVSLDEIQKSLEDYLETKRQSFSRFYFLSNDELLEILSQTRDPQAVQPHLGKCFDAMARIDFATDADGVPTTEVVAMLSPEAEKVRFVESVQAVGAVEMWLGAVETMMKLSLYDDARACINSMRAGAGLEEWTFGFAAQSILMIGQVSWTAGVENALHAAHSGTDKKALAAYNKEWIQKIQAMVELVRGQLSPLQRTILGAKLVIDVHARDTVATMVAQEVERVNDFEWQRQLRYYWEEEVADYTPYVDGPHEDCVIRQTNSRFVNGYEYLGNTPRLVITPLTDKCYMTLTGALHLRLGGAPAGPAGTGKTETTKDLAKALSRQCVVFNCSDGLDYKMMGRFFSGLAQSGAWACFDEFNRINIEVLSVIAQQIQTIQNAIAEDKARFIFEGVEIPLNKGYGVFITMNPGYAGRAELPDNLKALFRPVAMMIPDYRLIAEIMLFSEGFAEARPLSQKMTQLYKLSSEQLSKQDHYDFGMRAVKSVLVMAGQLKRSNPELPENIVLIRALRDSNLPKFLHDDVPLFMSIIQDLFPGVEIPNVDYGRLQEAIEYEMAKAKLQAVPTYLAKIIQLFETMLVRHGVMVVGLTLTGKTCCHKMLANALSQLKRDGDESPHYEVTHRYTLNPKSVTMGELYGSVNAMTQEWSDGLVPTLVRMAVADETLNRKWIVFDGPVDAIWIENMNTVLDDNKMLCLSNGERIKLTRQMHMVFEVNDLAVASPATVSRCGMVYMEAVYIGWRPFTDSWAQHKVVRRLPDHGDFFSQLFETYVERVLKFVRSECKEGVASVDANLVSSCLSFLDALLTPEMGVVPDKAGLSKLLRRIFLFAVVWSFGGNLHDSSRERFSTWMRDEGIVTELVPDFPDGVSVYDFLVSAPAEPEDSSKEAKEAALAKDKETPPIQSWGDVLQEFTYDRDSPFFNILVPTTDTTCYSYLFHKLVNNLSHIMVAGETGTGKSVMVQDYLKNAGDSVVSISAAFSAQTSARNVQDLLEAKLEKLRKNLLGPPSGKQMVLFVDDINMPALEVYGAQPPIELLRQAIDQGGFYDIKKLFFKAVQNTSVVAACGPPGGGRNAMTPRLMRHMCMLWVPLLSPVSMRTIFTSIMSGFLSVFAEDVSAMSPKIIEASIDIYNQMCQSMLPTPAKSHYTFNLRDLSKVVQGMLQITPQRCGTSDELIKLWSHEMCRVFRDRLTGAPDRTRFNDMVRKGLADHLDRTWQVADFDELAYGAFMAPDPDARVYEPIAMDQVQAKFDEYLNDYNVSSTKPMNLVFFKDACMHALRIARILRAPRGNALLVGVGGSGRQSLTRLATAIWEMEFMNIEITRTYDQTAFREDLKRFLLRAGGAGNASADNCQTVFYFSDTQIVKESFLEDINNILNSGEVPNLFEVDEFERIISSVRPLAVAAGKVETRDAIYQHFVQLVRENLHIVICMSPIGDAFRVRCRMFPSLINCCTIDWFNEWPQEALLSVAQHQFAKVDLGTDEIKAGVCDVCVAIHYDVSKATSRFYDELRRITYTTPTSYLELLTLFLSTLAEQRLRIAQQISRYRGGVDKLIATNRVVDSMKAELTEMQPILVQAQKDTNKLLEEVTRDQEAADVVKEQTEKEEAAVGEIASEAGAIAADAQRDLDEAMPAYHAAVDALKSLDKKDIQEVKSYAKPPELVQMVMEAVCILLGSKPDWNEAKKLLADTSFMETLQTYDKDNIPEKLMTKVRKGYTSKPNFVPDTVGKVSSAARSLCMWVRAMDTYSRVATQVAPKKAKLEEATRKLNEAQAMLKEKQDALAEVEARVGALKQKLQAAERKAQDLKEKEQAVQKKLERAGKLVGGLGSEKERWEALCVKLEESQKNLIGNMVLCSGAIAYQGPFTANYRSELSAGWAKQARDVNIPCEDNFSVTGVLGDPVTIREWAVHGLPSDQLSIENAIFVTRSRRWPLMIDPQGQANSWIKRMERDNKLVTIKLSQGDYLRRLESAIRVGLPVLLENVEETLEPSIDPVLLKQVFKQSGRNLIRLGDTDVDYSDDFKLYVTSKLANPHYPPEICIKVTVVNFTVTFSGLENQLLAECAALERPDLEERKEKLVLTIANGRRTMADLEDKILKMLAEASGNILDDEDLINTLDNSKKTSSETEKAVSAAEETSKEIDEAREEYRPVASRGSIIYFVVADFAGVDAMYQYSLPYFKGIFANTITNAKQAENLSERLKILIDAITFAMFAMICRGLFERHKALFAFMIAVQIARHAKEVTDDEWKLFLQPAVLGIPHLKKPNGEDALWLDDRTWSFLCAADDIPSLFGLAEHVAANLGEWKKLYMAEAPHSAPLPEPWQGKLKPFQRLLVLKLLRPEKVVFGTTVFIGAQLGDQFVEPPPFDLEATFKDSAARTPLIFVLVSGADPTQYLFNLAKAQGYELGSNLHLISLGQGQGPIAERLMDQTQSEGGRLCLQNCHLAESWLPRLDRKLEELRDSAEGDVHEDFRLWLTTMPTSKFPVTVLQNSLKLTIEPPKGLKANMARSYAEIEEKFFDSSAKPGVFKNMMFGLAFFNAVIQERRKYGAVGWNIPYQWMTSDLITAQQNLRIYVDEQPETPYDALMTITADVVFGGRITDKMDVRTARTVLEAFFNPGAVEQHASYCPQLDSRFKYAAPPEGPLDSYRKYISTFPLVDRPEIFGLHQNADISSQQKESKDILDAIIAVQPRTSSGGSGKSNDEIVAEMAADLARQMPPALERKEADGTVFRKLADGSVNPLGIFLSHEMHKFNRLIKQMVNMLHEMQRAIKGLVVMSAELDAMYANFLFQQVPGPWGENGKGYPSLKPLSSWFKDFVERVAFMRKWLSGGPPTTFWISCFFFPQGFFTSALQAHARKFQLPIDQLLFRTAVMKSMGLADTPSPPENGVYIHGMFMEGARWNKEDDCIDESHPGELFAPVPVVWLQPAMLDDPKPVSTYECPFYKTNIRAGTLSTTGHSTNHVCNFDIPTKADAGHWVRRGAALISQLNA